MPDENSASSTSAEAVPAPIAESAPAEASSQDEKTAPEPTVPLSALHEERRKRQELQQRLEKAEQEVQPQTQEDDFPPEQLEVLKRAAQKIGLVPKSEWIAEQVTQKKQDIVNSFVAKNPVYAKTNDPYDKNWTALLGALQLYNTSTPELLEKALQKAHTDISSQDLERQAQLKAHAQIQTNSMASAGGGGGASQNDDVSLTPEEKKRYAAWGLDEKYVLEAKRRKKK